MREDRSSFRWVRNEVRRTHFELDKEAISLELKPYDNNQIYLGELAFDDTLIDLNMKRRSLMDILKYPASYSNP